MITIALLLVLLVLLDTFKCQISNFVILFQDCFDYSMSLKLPHMNFRMHFFSSYVKKIRILIVIVLNL